MASNGELLRDTMFLLSCLAEPGRHSSKLSYGLPKIPPRDFSHPSHLSGNGDLDLDAGVNVDNDLLDHLSRGGKAASVLVPIVLRTSSAKTARKGEGKAYSIRRLWMRISKQSQVLEPSPQGVLRVVILRVLVGRRTGPL